MKKVARIIYGGNRHNHKMKVRMGKKGMGKEIYSTTYFLIDDSEFEAHERCIEVAKKAGITELHVLSKFKHISPSL